MTARILIIEDNPVSLQLTTQLLQARGYPTLTAGDCARGVALAKQQQPDLVICDLQLPVVNGYQVLQLLQQDPLCSKIPVVAVTAFSKPGEDAEALAAGFRGFIPKPLQSAHFVRQIEAFLPPESRSLQPENVPAMRKRTWARS